MPNINFKAIRTTMLCTLATTIAGLAITPKITWAQSDPNVSWGWVYLNINKSDCLARARLAIQTELDGILRRRTSNYISWRSRSGDTFAFIQCFPEGNSRSLSVIVVSSSDRYAPMTRDILFDAMEMGVFEGNIFPGTVAENEAACELSEEYSNVDISLAESHGLNFLVPSIQDIAVEDATCADNERNGVADSFSSEQDNPEADNANVTDDRSGVADSVSSEQDDPEADNADECCDR